MGIGSSGVVNCANTYLGTANYTVADGYVADRTPIVGGNGPAQLNLNFARDEVLDPRVTFSRTSNATRVNAQGLIEYAPHNLLTNSENFDNAVWAKSNATVTANAVVAPDGTTTADKLVENTAASVPHGLAVDTSSLSSTTQYTFSVYAKAGERTWVRLGLVDNLGTDGGRAWFDLSTGVVGTVEINGAGSNINATITSIGAGWYRCRLTIQMNNGKTTLQSQVRLATANNVLSYTGDGTSGIYIWGAQLNIGSLQPYYTTSVKNLLGYSQNFENAAWTKSNSTIDATPVMGPLGFLGAEKLVEDTATTTHFAQQAYTVTSGTPYTISAYVKAGERSYVSLLFASAGFGTNTLDYFNLQTGTVASTQSGTAAIQSIGNGWYRISATRAATASVSTLFQIRLAVGTPTLTSTYTGDGTSGIYIFGAQLSDSASLDPYVYNFGAAPTSSVYYGPRFDYDPVTLAPKGLLIEEARTNLLTYSSEFDNAAWSKTNATVTANAIVAPDGTLSADKLIPDSTLITDHTVNTATVTIGTTYTVTVYAKAAGYNYLFIRGLGLGGSGGARFNLQTGVVEGVANYSSASITALSNGWYRCIATGTALATTGVYFNVSNQATFAAFSGDGTSGIYLWGAQLEAGSFPTSYIPTTSASVTRTADNASMVGTNFSSWYNQSEGTVATEYDVILNTGNRIIFDIGSGGTLGTSAYNVQTATYVGLLPGTAPVNMTSTVNTTNLTNKIASGLQNNNSIISVNTVLGPLDTSCAMPASATIMTIGSSYFSSSFGNFLNGHIQSFKFFSKRLLNSYLQSLTQ